MGPLMIYHGAAYGLHHHKIAHDLPFGASKLTDSTLKLTTTPKQTQTTVTKTAYDVHDLLAFS
eukprot:1159301-Amphidinium_carterae.1